MKNLLMPIVLAVTMGLAGSNLYGALQESKPTPSPAPTPTLAETAGKTASKAGTDFLKGLGGTAATTAAAAAGIPPLNLNLNISTDVVNCVSGDTVTNVTGNNNQVQNVISATCNRVAGATGDVVPLMFESNKVITVAQVMDLTVMADTAYNFNFSRGTGSIASVVKNSARGYEVVLYTTRSKASGFWVERYSFGVTGNPFGAQGIAPMRVYPNGNVQIFFPNPVNPKGAVRFEINLLNPRTAA